MSTDGAVSADDVRYVLTRHRSFFRQREHAYLYHDLYGYILELADELLAVLSRWGDTPRSLTEAGQLCPAADVGGMRVALEQLVEHDVLVPPDTDELARLVERIPVKARWRVVLREPERTRFVCVVGRNLELSPRLRVLDGVAARIWSRIDGETTVRELALAVAETEHDVDVDDALRAVVEHIARWTHSGCQLTRVSTVPMSFYGVRGRPPYLDSSMPFDSFSPLGVQSEGERGQQGAPLTKEHAPAPDVIDLSAYHAAEIDDAAQQFEDVETTLSHLFRRPHPALGGRTYAQAFASALERDGLLSPAASAPSAAEIVEVGGGLGFFAEGLVEALRHLGDAVEPFGFRYTIVDLSPELQAAQRARLARFEERVAFRLENGEALQSWPDGSVDLLVSNEVIADFRTARMERDAAPDDARDGWASPDAMLAALEEDAPVEIGLRGPREAVAAIEQHGIDLSDAPQEFLFNLGAVRFLEQVARVLKPGGHAVVTEYGDRWRYPVESLHLDHAEVSIHFGHLLHVAESLGLQASVVTVPDWLDMDTSVPSMSSTATWFRNLRCLAAHYGAQLEKIAYTPTMLRDTLAGAFDPDQLEVLRWTTLDERVHGLVPHEFKALIVSRPRSQAE